MHGRVLCDATHPGDPGYPALTAIPGVKSKEESWKILEFPRPHPRPSTRPNEIALPGLGERGRLKLLVGIAHQNLAVKSRVHLSAAPATPMYQENHAEAAQCGAADGNKRDRLSLGS